MLWSILLLFGLVSLLLVVIICNSSSRLILLRLGREYKCIHPYFSSIIILSIELLFCKGLLRKYKGIHPLVLNPS
jgi:hypothetical protein